MQDWHFVHIFVKNVNDTVWNWTKLKSIEFEYVEKLLLWYSKIAFLLFLIKNKNGLIEFIISEFCYIMCDINRVKKFPGLDLSQDHGIPCQFSTAI